MLALAVARVHQAQSETGTFEKLCDPEFSVLVEGLCGESRRSGCFRDRAPE